MVPWRASMHIRYRVDVINQFHPAAPSRLSFSHKLGMLK